MAYPTTPEAEARARPPQSTPVVLRDTARAKINLSLHVLGRRADGYHELDSLVVFADIGDTIEISTPSAEAGLAIDGPFADALSDRADDDNLVSRAARAVATETGVSAETLQMRLTKKLPVAAGLGGGSADAAAVIRLLASVHGRDSLVPRLVDIAATLGADVPMCLWSKPLIARGKGEILIAANGIPPLNLVLVYPATPVSTAQVFARLGGQEDAPMPPLPERFTSAADFVRWLRHTQNGLENAARDQAPVIGHALQALSLAPGSMLARMSGSGSSCFGVFPFAEAAEHAARAIRAAAPGWWVVSTTTRGS